MMQTNMLNPCLPCELHLTSVIFHQALDVLQHSYILSLRLLEVEKEYQSACVDSSGLYAFINTLCGSRPALTTKARFGYTT
jgi:hypothetical protein